MNMRRKPIRLSKEKGGDYDATEGAIKLRAWFLEVVRKEPFLEEVAEIRQKYDIPEQGYVIEIDDKKWWETFSTRRMEFENDLSQLSDKYALYCPYAFNHPVTLFIAYGAVWPPGGIKHMWDLCDYSDRVDQKDSHLEVTSSTVHKKSFPIAIFISPYANKSDIIDYVDKTYSNLIVPLQKKYRRKEIGLGVVKSKDSHRMEMRDFIYQHRHLPLVKIASKITAKFGAKSTPGYAEIGKLLSLEKGKRR